jgi:hypothetical protein
LLQQPGLSSSAGAIQIAPLRGTDAAHGDHERGAAHRRFAHAQQ